MRIDEAQKNDLGNYLVVAENKAGMDQTNCNLLITHTANIDETPLVNPDAFKFLEQPPTTFVPNQNLEDAEKLIPPHVIIPLQDTQIKEGEPVLLVAKIDGYPKPKVIISPFIFFSNYFNFEIAKYKINIVVVLLIHI